jgi:hypothetical protein
MTEPSPLTTDVALFLSARSRAHIHVRSGRTAPLPSAPQAQLGDEAPVALHVLTTQVVEESPALTDHQQQTTTAVVVVLVVSKMLGQMVDPLGEQSHLNLR